MSSNNTIPTHNAPVQIKSTRLRAQLVKKIGLLEEDQPYYWSWRMRNTLRYTVLFLDKTFVLEIHKNRFVLSKRV
jgi:hypothetical protein